MRRFIPLILFLSFFLIAVMTSSSIGPSWDEPDNIYAAGVYLNFFSHSFNPTILTSRDQSIYEGRIFSQQESMERYPPVPLILGALFTGVVERVQGPLNGAGIIQMFHVTSGMFLALLVVFVYLWGELLGLTVVESVAAALIAGFFPAIFGHGLSNLKDISQVALFTGTLYCLVKSSLKKSRSLFLLGTVAWGLALATKFNAIYVPIVWGSWEVSRMLLDRTGMRLNRVKSLLGRGLVLGMLGLITMIIVWPYLWFDPISRLQAVVTYFTTVGTGYSVIWDGVRTKVGEGSAIWWYPLGYLAVSTPIILLLLGLTGFLGILWQRYRNQIKNPAVMVLFFWFLIPLVRSFLPHAAFYDGIRHFMEILPALCLFIIFGTRIIFSANKRLILFRPLLFMCLICYLIILNTIYFPYSTGYMNVLAQRQNENYDRDFSGLAVKEGMDYLTHEYATMAVHVPIGGHLSWYYVRPSDVFVYTPTDADSIIFINKPSHATKAELEAIAGPSFKVVYVMKRGSAILGWVYRRI